METEHNFSAARRKGASRATRADPAAKSISSATSTARLPELQKALRNLPDSRPDAVRRARKLIADPDYPPKRAQQALARHLAARLKDEIDPLPS
jgi:2,4-dienoyl-CoA reductase-like NADH-dependent reductase (Old Yellow Enzyme family)